MLEYNRIDILDGIDINKTNASKDCDICHYWYFLSKDFYYKPCLCNGCHNLREYWKNRYHNMSEEKQNLKEYRESYCEANKSRTSAESRNKIKMHYYIHNKLLILMRFFLISLCIVLAQ